LAIDSRPYEYWDYGNSRNCYSGGVYLKSYRRYWGTTQPVFSANIIQSVGADKYFPVVSGNTIQIAVNNCIAAISKGKINLGTVAAEMIREAGQLSQLLQKIGKILLALLRKNWKLAAYHAGLRNPGKRLDDAANAYLAMKFAILPLVRTAMDLASGIATAVNEPEGVALTVRGYADDNDSLFITPQYIGTGQVTRGAQVGVTYYMTSETLSTLGGLGLLQPVATAWELVSLSFVIDWFFSVGSFLQGLNATHGYAFGHGYTTTFSKGKVTYRSVLEHALRLNGSKRYAGTFPEYTIDGFAMKRDPMYVFPRPGLSYTFDLDLSKLVTLMALIQQQR